MSVHHQREVTSGNGKASMGSPIEIEARSWLAIFVDHSGSKKRDMNEYVMIVMIYPLKRPLNNGGTYDSPMDDSGVRPSIDAKAGKKPGRRPGRYPSTPLFRACIL